MALCQTCGTAMLTERPHVHRREVPMTEPEQPWRHVPVWTDDEIVEMIAIDTYFLTDFPDLSLTGRWIATAMAARIERDEARARVEELDGQLANCGAALVRERRAEKGAAP